MKSKKLRTRDLYFGYETGKICVVDTNRDDDDEFLKVAYIDKDRKVEFLGQKLSDQQVDAIHFYAATADPTLSLTQQRVFSERPRTRNVIRKASTHLPKQVYQWAK